MTSPFWLTRRGLIGATAAACVPCLGRPLHVAGVQLYTVRDLIQRRPLETLQTIADLGYREIEMLRNQIALVTPLLKQVSLRPVSLHFETPLITGNWEAGQHAEMPSIEPGVTFEDTLGLARDYGFQYLVFNYLTPEERLDWIFTARLPGSSIRRC